MEAPHSKRVRATVQIKTVARRTFASPLALSLLLLAIIANTDSISNDSKQQQ